MGLSPKQKAFLNAYLENPILPMSVVAERMSIPKDTLYGWRAKNINGFKDVMDEELANKWEEAKYMASDTIFSLAREGDFKAAKYILDYSGYQATQKVEANVNSAINISIISSSEEE